jgi:hypothetical protein
VPPPPSEMRSGARLKMTLIPPAPRVPAVCPPAVRS